MARWLTTAGALLCLAVVVAGCTPRPDFGDFRFRGIPIVAREVIEISVAADLVTCHGIFGSHPCVSVRFPDGQEYGLVEGIAGYSHLPGIPARLLVERVELDQSSRNFPTDTSSIQYVLFKPLPLAD